MTIINIGTNKGNLQGIEFDKPFEEITYEDVRAIVRRKIGEWAKIDGWVNASEEEADAVPPAAEDEPWSESEDCEYCLEEMEQDGIEYTHDFTWENGTWVCDHCGRPQ